MKKVLFILVIFLSLYGIYKINNKEVQAVVLKEKTFFNLDDYNVFYLNLEEENITTKNLKDLILTDMTIISITPYINPIYSEKINNLKYKFENISYKRNINNFTKYYIGSIKSNFNDNLDYITTEGIKINEIELYSKGSDIVNIIYKYQKIKYKNYLNENYNYLEF